jgi:glutamate racemase
LQLTPLPETGSTNGSSNSSGSIGIFDSGIGGLSILQHVQALLPQHHLLYFADSSFAPYGEKPEQVIVERALQIAEFLLAQGAKALVVACNTATVAAIRVLREFYPALPIVGVEPGLKPAASATKSGIVGVLATDRTLQGEKFATLQREISQLTQVTFLLQACTGLAHQIELGQQANPHTQALLLRYIPPLLDQGADTLVLGCTHYPFVREQIEQIIALHQPTRPVTLIDTGAAVARQLQRLVGHHRIESDERNASSTAGSSTSDSNGGAARLTGFTSGKQAALQQAFATLLHLTPNVFEVREKHSNDENPGFALQNF